MLYWILLCAKRSWYLNFWALSIASLWGSQRGYAYQSKSHGLTITLILQVAQMLMTVSVSVSWKMVIWNLECTLRMSLTLLGRSKFWLYVQHSSHKPCSVQRSSLITAKWIPHFSEVVKQPQIAGQSASSMEDWSEPYSAVKLTKTLVMFISFIC